MTLFVTHTHTIANRMRQFLIPCKQSELSDTFTVPDQEATEVESRAGFDDLL